MPVLNRILVIKPSSLGDIIHGLQIVESIRAQLPQVQITWVVESAFKKMVAASTTVDAVIVFERKGGIAAFVRLLKEIRAQRYDAVLDLQGLARSGLMTCAARSTQKIGRNDAREGATLFYKKAVALPNAQNAHAVDILAKFLPALGLKEEIVSSLRFNFPDFAQDPTLGCLKGAILLFPESRRAEKEWPAFAEFIQSAAEKYPQLSFVWCASARSAEHCPQAGNIVNLAGKTDLSQVITLIQQARAVVANDSGPIHIAAAVGCPVLGLYGPTPPALYGPYPLEKATHHTLQADDGHMRSISVEAALSALHIMVNPADAKSAMT